MKNNKQIIGLIVLSLMCWSISASASEVTGTIETGVGTGIGGMVIKTPTASPVAGTYGAAQDVVLTADGANSIYYTFDGTAPSCSASGNSVVYSQAIPVDTSRTIKALSCYNSGAHSNIASFEYIINIVPPECATVAHALTYNPFPTCGALTCENGYTLSGGACVVAGGGGGGGGGGNPPPAPIVGDINGDSTVNKYDFSLLMANWGATGANSSDLNGDGVVDKYDFSLLMANWSAT
jgi:hypothetical protein